MLHMEHDRIMSTPDTEKLSINLSVVDLGQIDLLVEQGFYSNRTDFIRTAARNLLQVHAPVVQEHVKRHLMGLGVMVYNRKSLERLEKEGKMVTIRMVGVVTISDDVTPELATATIESIKVLGALRASPAVKKVLEAVTSED